MFFWMQQLVLALVLSAIGRAPAAAADRFPGDHVPTGQPAASIDLRTAAGASLMSAQWRYHDTRFVEVEFPRPGKDGQPTGAVGPTWDFEPHAGAADYDDSLWPVIAPESLAERRGFGRLSFNWYRIGLVVPERVGAVEVAGSTIVLETSLDDYAEIWVDGEIARRQGQQGGSVIAGWNANNRLVIARAVRPGQRIQVAVFGANGPLSNPPTNFIWMREARLDFYSDLEAPVAVTPQEVNVEIDRFDPRIDRIVGPNPKVFKLAEGFQFTEGPVWSQELGLLFSDPNANRIYRYANDGELSVFRERSGYQGADVARYRQPGSNGLALDRNGVLTVAEHGNRRISRLVDGKVEVIADRYQGKRFNSPNDLVFRSDGMLLFTDPPFGLPGFADDPAKELPWSGVFAVTPRGIRLLTRELSGPNGIALSPDEKTLYVGNWADDRKVVLRFALGAEGSVGPAETLLDVTAEPGEDAIDGIKVDREGNVFVSGPGGVWVVAPDGTRLGLIKTPRHAHNFAWGGAEGKTLFLCARSALYRMDLGIGIGGSVVSATQSR